MTRPSNKYSMILRIWCADQSDSTCWRASLEDPETGKRLGFSSLEQLFVFLLDLTEKGRSLEMIDKTYLEQGYK
jgi:hypothetical protein